MEAKEKARELVEKFRDDKFTSQITTAGAKQCASICVQEIVDVFKNKEWPTLHMDIVYWGKVLTEIQSL